jgi:NADPH-dependent 2,4-dienoyl-CoA reductase/sulfur reductase-like enzyme
MDGLPVFEVRVDGDNVFVKGNLDEVRTSKRTGSMCSHKVSDKRTFVIVGGGASGASCAQALRKNGFEGRIVIIGKEMALPYDRPKLSKAMTVTLNSILLRNADFWSKFDVEFKLGTTVTELDAEKKTVTMDNGETISYDACLVATGGTPRGLPVQAPSAKGFSNVFLLRDFDQAGQIDEQAAGKKVLIVGSSFIGMEVAAAISAKASSILVIGMEKVPFERVLGMEIGGAMQRLHETKGIKFQMQATLKDVRHDGDKVTSVILNSGEEIECDMICVGAGVIPTTSFIKGLELAKPDNSVLCDVFMKTQADGLYAAGDIARFPLGMLNDRLARIEHWGMALKQGQIAALNMLGKATKLDSIPYFWTGMYGKTVRYCGHGLDVDKVIMDMAPDGLAPETLKFLAFYSSKGKIVAVASIARDPLVSICAELMQANKMPSADEIQAAIDKQGSAEPLIRSLL